MKVCDKVWDKTKKTFPDYTFSNENGEAIFLNGGRSAAIRLNDNQVYLARIGIEGLDIKGYTGNKFFAPLDVSEGHIWLNSDSSWEAGKQVESPDETLMEDIKTLLDGAIEKYPNPRAVHGLKYLLGTRD